MQLNSHRVGQGEPLLLVHGIGSRWQMWLPVMDALAARHDVIAIDLPGFAGSAMPPPGTPPGIDSLVGLIDGFLAEIGVQRPHAAGNSLGGLVALEMARRGRVRSATALSPAGFATAAETAVTRVSLRAAALTARRMASRADWMMSAPWRRRLALNLFVKHPAEMPAEAAAANLRGLAEAGWFDETLPAVGPMSYGPGGPVSVPVTVAWGDHDRLLRPRQLARAGQAIPGAKLVRLPGCGHIPTYDDPALVARVLLEGTAAGDAGATAAARS
jgi:pimeloyl-ACP methyl ester carboxylesterase